LQNGFVAGPQRTFTRRHFTHVTPGGKMSTPAGGRRILDELEITVSTELTVATTSQPQGQADGVSTAEWLPDPDAERYEVALRTLLGAVEALEDGSRGSDHPPQDEMAESARTAGHLPGALRPGSETEGG
jgi:hypothetical protein